MTIGTQHNLAHILQNTPCIKDKSIPAWISNHKLNKVRNRINYLLPNFNFKTVEVYEWISNFTQHFIMDRWPKAIWLSLTLMVHMWNRICHYQFYIMLKTSFIGLDIHPRRKKSYSFHSSILFCEWFIKSRPICRVVSFVTDTIVFMIQVRCLLHPARRLPCKAIRWILTSQSLLQLSIH